jgi:hypothetical protein
MTERDLGSADEQEGRRLPRVQERQGRGPRRAAAGGTHPRLAARRADDSLEFIGEDRIDHTPKDEKVRIKLGSAFDVVGERRQVDFAIDTKARWMEEEIEVKLRNHKDQPVEVIVKETLYRWSNWKVMTKTHEFTKEDARTIHFPVRVAKDGEAVVRYRVRYITV